MIFLPRYSYIFQNIIKLIFAKALSIFLILQLKIYFVQEITPQKAFKQQFRFYIRMLLGEIFDTKTSTMYCTRDKRRKKCRPKRDTLEKHYVLFHKSYWSALFCLHRSIHGLAEHMATLERKNNSPATDATKSAFGATLFIRAPKELFNCREIIISPRSTINH